MTFEQLWAIAVEERPHLAVDSYVGLIESGWLKQIVKAAYDTGVEHQKSVQAEIGRRKQPPEQGQLWGQERNAYE